MLGGDETTLSAFSSAFRLPTGLSIRPEILRLVRERVVDVQEQHQRSRDGKVRRISRQLPDLEAQERKLRDAYIFIFRGAIAQEVFEQEQARINDRRESLASALADARRDAGDLSRTLTRVERVLTDLGRSWKRANPLSRRKLQRLIYPEGVPVLAGTVGNAPTHDVFRVFRLDQDRVSHKAASISLSWKPGEALRRWLEEAKSLAEVAGS